MRTFLCATIAFVTAYCAYFSLAVARHREAPLPDVAQLIARRRRRMANASPSVPAAPPPPATAAAAATATAREGGPARLLTQADVLRRVPEGGAACSKRRPGSTACLPGLLRLTLQALGCATLSGQAAEPLRAWEAEPLRAWEAAPRP